MQKVVEDKEREVKMGHDGTWVAHPALVKIAKDVFDKYMTGPNQIHVQIHSNVTPKDLLVVPKGTITLDGLRQNISVGIQVLS